MAIHRFRKDELESQLNRSALWAVVYGDLMSYLMILFLLMLSFSLARGLGTRAPKVNQSLVEIQRIFGGKADEALSEKAAQKDMEMLVSDRLKRMAEEGSLGQEAQVVVSEKRISLALGEGILFDSGRAEVKPQAIPILRTVAKDMVNLKNEIRVEGHTDNVPVRGGPYSSNWELSMARAYAVIRKLEELGVDPRRLSGVGYGEYRPIASNATPAGRAKNRRIEISLLRGE